MDKQLKTYVLIAGVVVVWGMIGYQIYSKFTTKEFNFQQQQQQSYQPKTIHNKAQYSIRKHERDPFLGTVTTANPVKVPRAKKAVSSVEFPNIRFNGVVKHGKKRAYIITVNGSQELFMRGELKRDIKLISGTNNTVRLRYKGVTKVFTLPK